jgi:hypothetical protein
MGGSTRIATRRFDQGMSRLEPAIGFGIFNDLQNRPVH